MNNQKFVNLLLVVLFIVVLATCYNHFIADDKKTEDALMTTASQTETTQ